MSRRGGRRPRDGRSVEHDGRVPQPPTGARTGASCAGPGRRARAPAGSRRRRTVELGSAIGVPVGAARACGRSRRRRAGSTRASTPARPTSCAEVGRPGRTATCCGTHLWVSAEPIVLGFASGRALGVAVRPGDGMSRRLSAPRSSRCSTRSTRSRSSPCSACSSRSSGSARGRSSRSIAATVFFFVWISTMAAVMSVPEGYREAALSFGVEPVAACSATCCCPASLPQIFVGLRIAAGVVVPS